MIVFSEFVAPDIPAPVRSNKKLKGDFMTWAIISNIILAIIIVALFYRIEALKGELVIAKNKVKETEKKYGESLKTIRKVMFSKTLADAKKACDELNLKIVGNVMADAAKAFMDIFLK